MKERARTVKEQAVQHGMHLPQLLQSTSVNLDPSSH